MFKIDPARTDLAREFKARPFGVHSADLQVVLNLMRGEAIPGKFILVCTKPHEEWTLARLKGDPLRAQLLKDYVFKSLEEAEWVVFKLRWKKLTGRDLDID